MEDNSQIIDGSNVGNRLKHLLACIPDVFNYKTMLYVGAGPRLQLFDEFVKHNYSCDIVEVFKPNILKLSGVSGIRTIYNDNILFFNPSLKYDVVVFWHGIEHIEKEDVPGLLKKISKYTNKLIVLGMPYGVYDQGALYNNPYEVHVSKWYPEDMKLLGFECDTIGRKDTKRANLLAWKRM